MTITATEFKMNLGKYLDMIKDEDIFITKNGKTIAKLTNPHVSAVDCLSGLLAEHVSSDLNEDMIKEIRISDHEFNDRY